MALSLADELGGAFDDGPQVGQSLADEFGLNLDGPNETVGRDDDFGGLQEDVFPGLEATSSLPHSPSPRKASPIKKGRSYCQAKLPTSSSQFTQNPRAASLIEDDLDLSIPSHDLHPSNGFLEEGANGLSGGFHAVDHDRNMRDPLVILEEVRDSTARLLSHLSSLDDPSSSSSSFSRAHSSKKGIFGIEAGLQRHLELMNESDRIREEQYREILALNREGAGVNWDGIDLDDIAQAGEAATPTMNGFSSHLEDRGPEEVNEDLDVGWTGDTPKTPNGMSSSASGLLSHMAKSEEDENIATGFGGDHHQLLDPDAMLDADEYHSGPSSGFRRHQAHDIHVRGGKIPHSHLPSLPRETAQVIELSTDLASSLSSLRETVHSTSSLATALARQLRGIKAGTESWRDRENQEDAAREQIAVWDRQRLERGLIASGKGVQGNREILQKVVGDFQGNMDEWSKKVGDLRQKCEDLRTAEVLVR